MKIKLDDGAFMPERAHSTDAGIDLKSPHRVTVPAYGSAIINTGVHVELPENTCGLLVSKSGLNVTHNITSTGLIDEGYTGEIVVKLYNHAKYNYIVNAGDKISQLVVIPVQYVDIELVDDLTASARGDNGFGSTGK